MFSTFDCAVKGIRKKEDPWNAIIAGFGTGGCLALRGGPRAIRNGAISCAILIAVIEGVSVGLGRMMAAPPPSVQAQQQQAAAAAAGMPIPGQSVPQPALA